MGLFDTTQFALQQALAGAAERQQVLANNIANANTPGFKRSDVDFHGALEAALQGGDQGSSLEAIGFSPQTDNSPALQADGNNVNVDTEMSNLSQNALDYQSMVEIANARLKMLSTAIGST